MRKLASLSRAGQVFGILVLLTTPIGIGVTMASNLEAHSSTLLEKFAA